MHDTLHNRIPSLNHCLDIPLPHFAFEVTIPKHVANDVASFKRRQDPNVPPNTPIVTKLAKCNDIVHFRKTYVKVDLDAMTDNCAAIRRHLGNDQRIAAVIKADAYGHGALASARHLSKTHAVDAFVVAMVEEGVELRRGGVLGMPIIVMSGSFEGAYEAVITHTLTPIIGNSRDLIAFSCAAKKMGQILAVQIEVDVGMARLGFDLNDLDALKELVVQLDNIVLMGVMAHPSHADDLDLFALDQQYGSFRSAIRRLESVISAPAPDEERSSLCHFSNSAVIARHANGSTGKGELVRVGLALHGIQPMHASQIEGLKPVLSWYTSVVAVRALQGGETVSYNGAWTATGRTKVATICVGYADGYPRSLFGKGFVMIHGQRAKLIGRLCMDFTMVDVTDILPDVDVGTKVTLIGNEPGAPSVEEVALWADTIPWELLACITKRVPRIHK